MARGISVHQTVFVVNQRHERFYRQEIGAIDPRTVVQPSNRGTLPAILWSVLRVVQFDPMACVAFFPSDHHYADEDSFIDGVGAAFDAAEADHESVVLLGARAHQPETSYGWIQPDRACARYSRFPIHRVKRFWEKPSLQTAQTLLEQDCLWNTFVMVGRAGAYLKLIESAAPGWYGALASATAQDPEDEACTAARAYAELASADFSSEAVSPNAGRFAVLALGDTGWSDLGDPLRFWALSSALERKPWVHQFGAALAIARVAGE